MGNAAQLSDIQYWYMLMLLEHAQHVQHKHTFYK